ncbi:deoxycytidylate deaminase [Candidatus Mycoplasma mahonii]|uniref:deoxycytidylate deaminase n=1 Tax=Candidatus Mycoplasma mahonii TaxID=3004105 RepID=UPI0026EB79C3|nr:dCMP deaminase family protein [Candidatus Mycoplasma mahonii]WKX02364.1 dCMP deaminase family protein [Candidatus Mycoplasma mahonii]
MKSINWDEYFMALAKVSALRSKDPNTKVGATIVNKKKRVIGLGYNGMPSGNDDFPWSREGKHVDTKYPYVIHAEMNAVLNAISNLEDSMLYVSLFPCSTCAKFLIQAGITEIIYENDKYKNTEDNLIAKDILKKSSITFRKMEPFELKI